MNIYKTIIRRLLFMFQPETAHKIILIMLKIPGIPLILKLFYLNKVKNVEFNKLGFKTKNLIGLAAGLDKNGEILKGLNSLGFGFIEIGTVTPVSQAGNPKPRLRRLVDDYGILNRMGFNNIGIEGVKRNIAKLNISASIGINIGKNKITPLELAYLDYVKVFNELYNYGDYFVINVSSPNTKNLRQLQAKESLEFILEAITNELEKKEIKKPLFLKIAPDLTNIEIDDIIDLVIKYKLTGLVATNTTIERNNLCTISQKISDDFGNGGLSGIPLKNRATEVIRYIKSKSDEQFLIIGVGGIFDSNDVKEKLDAGADLIQIYTSFIYEGPGVVKKLLKQIYY